MACSALSRPADTVFYCLRLVVSSLFLLSQAIIHFSEDNFNSSSDSSRQPAITEESEAGPRHVVHQSISEAQRYSLQGYIGEKGIGFKSVFTVAKKVHIQSGPFSFSFEYTRINDDDGLGMVTPLDEDLEELPEDVGTRMTLTLLSPSHFEERVRDLLSIPNTLLLFLSTLETLRIKINRPNGEKTIIEYTMDFDDENIQIIKKRTNGDEEFWRFYVVKKKIVDLPPDDARKNINKADVVLAFPIDMEEDPIIDKQQVFAFLPICDAGFSVSLSSWR